MRKQIELEKKSKYKKICLIIFMAIIIIPVIIFEIAMISVVPFVLIPEIILVVLIYFMIRSIKKKRREAEEQKQKERELIAQGYIKISENFFIKDQEDKVNILDNIYGFSQIVDCELIENGTYISNGTEEICTQLDVNITIEDLGNPRIVIHCINEEFVYKNSKKYKDCLDDAHNILSTLKIIIKQNNEKYVENGTITKIEHKYITEENASIQIERLSELYKDGILTEYEFEMKKKELLDKVK